jgi:hypothetical protein
MNLHLKYLSIYLTEHKDELFTLYIVICGYGLDDGGSRFRFPARAGNFSLHHSVQNGSGVHPAFYPMGIRGSFPGGKAAGS